MTATDTPRAAISACDRADACRADWRAAYLQVRQRTLTLTAGLSAEDQALQAMPETSPSKWHLAHTTWFFETLVLLPHAPGYQAVDVRWAPLFNSYYEALGPRHPRPQRGLLSRPSLDQVHGYRQRVDAAMLAFIGGANSARWAAAAGVLRLGLHHEQQHQELLLTDIRQALAMNPLLPAYAVAPAGLAPAGCPAPPLRWTCFGDGPVRVGHDATAGAGFAFDNESPRHSVWLAPFELASRPVSNGEFLDFMHDGGYRQPALWLSDGWAQVQAQGWQAPAAWLQPADGPAGSGGAGSGDGWRQFTLHGEQPLDLAAPVCHLSAYEAAAFAAWAGARLPTEFEWEHAARQQAEPGGLRQGGPLCPVAQAQAETEAGAKAADGDAAALRQLHGEVWQWTASAYAPYPGFRPLPGPAAEYNGKFMVNQLVLRGSSFATPAGHARHSYRNFFPPAARWQFSGLRLARDAG